MRISVHGAGVAGLLVARMLVERGFAVRIHSDGVGCSPVAGGMLAPLSELDAAEPHILEAGADAVQRWTALVGPDSVLARGTLHVAHRPEWPLLEQLARRGPFQRVGAEAIGQLEPLLAGRFQRGLFAPDEGAVDPAVVLEQLGRGIERAPVVPVTAGIDARGLRSPAGLRGVRGEYLMLDSPVQLTRPVRLAHPRYPLYVVPRAGNGVYVGATQLEREDDGPAEVRSLLELLSALYSLHPSFGDAKLLQTGAALRPAFPDNAPRVWREGEVVHLNGLYRHGYLLGPALAERAVQLYLEGADAPHTDRATDQRRAT